MKAITAIGIAGAFAMLLLAVLMEGGNPMSFFNIEALLIVAGGTAGASFASTDFETAKRAPALVKLAFAGAELDQRGGVRRMVSLAEKARRDGLLALEDDVNELEDGYARKGLQLVVDGADSDLVRAILQSEIDGMQQRHAHNYGFFTTAGGFAPTLGILGTVMSLVHVLENLDSPSSLGHSIAGAFIATLYGVGSANLIFLPISNKLKQLSKEELGYREMLLEAILSIQAGDNPRLLAEKLETFVAPALRHDEAAERREAREGAEQAPPPPEAEAA